MTEAGTAAAATTHKPDGEELDTRWHATAAAEAQVLRWLEATSPASTSNSIIRSHYPLTYGRLPRSPPPPTPTPFPLLDLPKGPLSSIATMAGPSIHLACKALRTVNPIRRLRYLPPPDQFDPDASLDTALHTPTIFSHLTLLDLTHLTPPPQTAAHNPAAASRLNHTLAFAAAHCTTLRSLRFSAASPQALPLLPPLSSTLHTLDIQGTIATPGWHGATPRVLSPISSLTALRSLSLPHLIWPPSQVLPEILPLPHLTHLNIRYDWPNYPCFTCQQSALPVIMTARLRQLTDVDLDHIETWDIQSPIYLGRMTSLTSLSVSCLPTDPLDIFGNISFFTVASTIQENLRHLSMLNLRMLISDLPSLPYLTMSTEDVMSNSIHTFLEAFPDEPLPEVSPEFAHLVPSATSSGGSNIISSASPLRSLSLTVHASPDDEDSDSEGQHNLVCRPTTQDLTQTLQCAPHLTHLALCAAQTARDPDEECGWVHVYNPFQACVATEQGLQMLLRSTPTTLRSLSLEHVLLADAFFSSLATALPQLSALTILHMGHENYENEVSHMTGLVRLCASLVESFSRGFLQAVGQLTRLTSLELVLSGYAEAPPPEEVWALLPLQQLQLFDMNMRIGHFPPSKNASWRASNPHVCAVLAHLPRLRQYWLHVREDAGVVWSGEDVRRQMQQLAEQHTLGLMLLLCQMYGLYVFHQHG